MKSVSAAQALFCILTAPLAFGQAAAPKPAPQQQPPPAKPAQAPAPVAKKTAPAKPAAAPVKKAGTSVDSVIEMSQAGVAEPMILKTLARESKGLDLSAADLIKLKKASVSDAVINAMMDPEAAKKAMEAPAAAAPAPVAEAAPSATLTPVAVTDVNAPVPTKGGARRKRVAVMAFDYSAVRTWVTFWFKQEINLGEGIRSLMVTRMAKMPELSLVERKRMKDLMAEQDLGASNRVNQQTKARIGKIKGADAIVFGDIVTFGRDDTTKKKGAFGGVSAGLCGHIRFFGCSVSGGLMKLNKEEKAVVVIDYRIVDAETGEVIDTGEARGESSRQSKDWGAVLNTHPVAGSAGSEVTSSNFAETIIGEATMDAVNKLTAELAKKAAGLPEKKVDVEGLVADVQGGTLYLNVGGNDGVQVGDKFEISKILKEVKDPVTQEVLDQQTEKVGDMVIGSVRDRTATGKYSGPSVKAGYAARKVN